ncbi:conjugal transfer protein [Nonomuraea sp. NBC_01738]|uniref:conjugal transfer protein n=1 Tax=Nonomuraea sp. NBC_01738 TaxID=2976003 RepID=UPI002E0F3DBE|nr:conjugal transfer protein [Nonomuraea sp. NBC_01738]
MRALFERATQENAPTSNASSQVTAGFPTDRASAFAAQFANVYLNFNAADAASRAGKLAAFLPDGAEQQFGWDGYGRLGAVGVQPYGVEVVDAKNGVVSVVFQSGNRRLLLSVPVYYSGDDAGRKFVVSGRPALLPAPTAADLPQVATPEGDDAAEAELKPQLEGFFKDYASGDTQGLQRYLAAGTSLPNLGGALNFAELKSVVVPVGGAIREIHAVVVWVVPTGATPSAEPSAGDAGAGGGRLEQAYRLTVEKQGDKWFVKDILGAGRAVG